MAENRLKAWLAARGIPPQQAADDAGIPRSTFYRYLLPLRHARFQVPRASAMTAIYCFTRGEVGPDAFYELPEPAP